MRLLRIEPDQVIVWIEAQKREAHEYHFIPEAKIAVTGAQLFDRWFDGGVTRDRAAFCERVGLPDDGPFVLFTGSSSFISESAAEVAFVRRWVEALRTSGDVRRSECASAPADVQPLMHNAPRFTGKSTSPESCGASGVPPISMPHCIAQYGQ